MKKGVLFVLATALALPAMAGTETFKNVSVVDVACSQKAAANPDAHTRECALECEKTGYGVITADKQYLKFDSAGNAQIAAELKKSTAKDHLRVNVTGDVKGDTLHVKTVKLL